MPNISPSVWGKSMWNQIFYIVCSYPNNPKYKNMKYMKKYLFSLCFTLPCETCRHNYNKYIKQNPITDSMLRDRKQLIKWLLELKNSIAIRNGKRGDLTYDDIIEKYDHIKNNGFKIIKPLLYIAEAYPKNPDNDDKENIINYLTALFDILSIGPYDDLLLYVSRNPVNAKIINKRKNLYNWTENFYKKSL